MCSGLQSEACKATHPMRIKLVPMGKLLAFSVALREVAAIAASLGVISPHYRSCCVHANKAIRDIVRT